MAERPHLLIAAAGTGGHVFPALAVARKLSARGWRVTWIGTRTGMESRLIAADGYPFHGLDFRGVRGRGPLGAVSGLIKLTLATWACRRLVGELAPDVLFTTGGYVAVPVTAGCRRHRVPVVVMNCDADLLMSTEMILKRASAVACGFAGSARTRAGDKGFLTGNPVRAEIEALPPPAERLAGRSGPLRLLVFGGSLGAAALNEAVPRALALFAPEDRPTVLHQCGAGAVEEVRRRYRELGLAAEVTPFIDDMAAAYRDSDLVICRSGATTVSELCAAGAAAIMVPFVARTTAHQLGNARYLAEREAGLLLEQGQLTPEHLFGLLASLRRPRLLRLAANARSLARPDPAQAVSAIVERAARGGDHPGGALP